MNEEVEQVEQVEQAEAQQPVVEKADQFADDYLSGNDVMRALNVRENRRSAPVEQPRQEQARQEQPRQQEKPAKEAAEPVSSNDRAAAFEAIAGIQRGEVSQQETVEIPQAVKDWAAKRGYNTDDVLNIDSLQKQVKEGEKYKSEAQELRSLLEAIPQDFRIAIDRAIRGENWKEPLLNSHTDIDFSKPFDKQDVYSMLRKFATDKVNEDVIEAAKDGDEYAKQLVDLASEVARTKYDAIKNEQDNHFRLREEQDRQFVQQYEYALNTSIQELQRIDPRVSALVPEIREGLTREGIHGLFFNENGMLRPEAARLYAVAKYQSELFDSKVKQAAKQAKDNAELEMMSRTSERPTNTIRTEVRKGAAPDKNKLAESQMDAWLLGADIMGKR